MRRGVALLAAVLLAAGCGGEESADVSTRPSVTKPPATTAPRADQQMLELYLLDPIDGKLYATRQQVDPPTKAVAGAALELLAQEPDSEVPPNLSVTIADGKARVTGSDLSPAALAQVVYTLTRFPTVRSVNGSTRKDVEEFVPPILVERPVPEESVSSPLRVTGNANTFEATFEYDLVDDTGKVLAHHFVTATSGSGQRGTFDFTVPFRVDKETNGALVVYERSAENGQRIHERSIPLTLGP